MRKCFMMGLLVLICREVFAQQTEMFSLGDIATCTDKKKLMDINTRGEESLYFICRDLDEIQVGRVFLLHSFATVTFTESDASQPYVVEIRLEDKKRRFRLTTNLSAKPQRGRPVFVTGKKQFRMMCVEPDLLTMTGTKEYEAFNNRLRDAAYERIEALEAPKHPVEVPMEPEPEPIGPRTFTDPTGKFEVTAILTKFENGTAHLEKEDGTVIEVLIESLSEADRAFIENMLEHAEGDREPKCPRCKGSGQVDCSNRLCRGGTVYRYPTELSRDRRSYRTRRILVGRCKDCGGKGSVPCTLCEHAD